MPVFLLVLMLLPSLGQAQTLLALRIGVAELQAEYAVTARERERGLMGRTELPANRGMLFRFDDFRRHCLWMKDTPLPLSAAFLDEAGRVVDLIDLEPLSKAIRCSREPARYALEVNRGWFAERGIGAGARVQRILGQ
ncbi:exported protein [Stutzerimonas stutzeri]|nr:exported protein [Stutzerimonas stutzeri]